MLARSTRVRSDVSCRAPKTHLTTDRYTFTGRTEKTKGENALADICTALKVLVLCPEANIVYTTS